MGYENPNGKHPRRGPACHRVSESERAKGIYMEGGTVAETEDSVTYMEIDQISKYIKENMVEGGL